MFMHNGGIGSFKRIKRKLAMGLNERWFTSVQGSTDSEWAFALFLDNLDKAGIDLDKDEGFGHTVLRKGILKTIERINALIKEVVGDEGVGEEDSRSLLNFAVTDGESVVCSRYVSSRTDEAASLFWSSGTSWKATSSQPVTEPGQKDYVMERRDKGSDIVLVASEPLTFERGESLSRDSQALYYRPKFNALLASGIYFSERKHPMHGCTYLVFLNRPGSHNVTQSSR